MIKKLTSTYIETLSLQHENRSFNASFCLTKLSLENLQEKLSDFLHPKERSYFDTLKYSKRQHSYLLGRYCAKQALSSLFNAKNQTAIQIENGVFQQPIVLYNYNNLNHSNFQVSISHTETIGAAIAFPESHPMAIDIENIDNNTNDIILTQLTTHERQLALTLPKDSGNAVLQPNKLSPEFPSLQMLWTIKEALSKVIKCGLTVPFELLEVESITATGYYCLSQFKNFQQYQSLSFTLLGNICSLVYPKNTKLDININKIQHCIDC